MSTVNMTKAPKISYRKVNMRKPINTVKRSK